MLGASSIAKFGFVSFRLKHEHMFIFTILKTNCVLQKCHGVTYNFLESQLNTLCSPKNHKTLERLNLWMGLRDIEALVLSTLNALEYFMALITGKSVYSADYAENGYCCKR